MNDEMMTETPSATTTEDMDCYKMPEGMEVGDGETVRRIVVERNPVERLQDHFLDGIQPHAEAPIRFAESDDVYDVAAITIVLLTTSGESHLCES